MATTDDDTPRTSLPANDAWTGMLAISLLALIAGCVLLFLDWRNHMEKPSKLAQPPITAQQDTGADKDEKEAPQPAPADGKKAQPEKKG
jgi:hypothetical protein